MIRSERRLIPCVQALLILAAAFGVAHCGGGELPPPASESIDAGPIVVTEAGTGSGVSFPDVDPEKGLTFGDNGFTDCGGQAPPQTITMQNPTASVINFNAGFTGGGTFYTVTPTAGGIPARGTAVLQIVPNAIPKESDVRADLYASTLEVKFPGKGAPAQIRLHQTARGAIIGFSPPTIAIGDVKVGQKGTAAVNFTNSGNAEVTATLATGNPVYSINGTPTANLLLGPGASQSTSIEFAPLAAGEQLDTLAVSYNSSAVHCKPPPTTAPIKSKGTTSVGVTPGVLDFGQVNCGATGDPQVVTITSTIAMKFTPVLTKGGLSPYTLANDAKATEVVASGNPIELPAASTYKLRVVPKRMEPVSPTTDNAFGDTLTVTTDLTGDTPHVVQLRQTAKGAILSFSVQAITTTGPVGQKIDTPFSLNNTGNAQVPYTITTTPVGRISPYTPGFVSNLTSGNAPVGNTAGVFSSFHPTSAGDKVSGTMTVALGAAGGVLCADLPPPVPLQATGSGAAVVATPTTLDFGDVDCSKQAAPQGVFIQSVTATKVTAELNLGPGSPYTFATGNITGPPCNPLGAALGLNPELTVGPGAPYMLCVVPKVIPVPTSTAANGLGDVLKLTSDIPAEPVKTVALQQTARGAFYSFSDGTNEITSIVGNPNISNNPVLIRNVGNRAGRYTVDGTPSANPGPGVAINHPPTPTPPVLYTPLGGGSVSHTYSVDASFTASNPVQAGIVITPDPDHNVFPLCSALHSLRVFTASCGASGLECCTTSPPCLTGLACTPPVAPATGPSRCQ